MTKTEAKLIVLNQFANSGLIVSDWIFQGNNYSDTEVGKINKEIDNFTYKLRKQAEKMEAADLIKKRL
jgi:hypothetical protein